jgi:hypothetical protein
MKPRSLAESQQEPPNQFFTPHKNPDGTGGSTPPSRAQNPSNKTVLLIMSAQASQVMNADGVSVTVSVSVALQGGQPPYNVDFMWSDGLRRNGTTGSTLRTFRLNQKIPDHVRAIARSADKQTATTTILVNNASPHLGGYSD